jgi:hypothetical protein
MSSPAPWHVHGASEAGRARKEGNKKGNKKGNKGGSMRTKEELVVVGAKAMWHAAVESGAWAMPRGIAAWEELQPADQWAIIAAFKAGCEASVPTPEEALTIMLADAGSMTHEMIQAGVQRGIEFAKASQGTATEAGIMRLSEIMAQAAEDEPE